MSPTSNRRSLAAAAAMAGGALFAAGGALQASGLDWTENTVETTGQHASLGLFCGALALTALAVLALSRYAGSRGRIAARVIAGAQIAIAVAGTVSNIRGIDAAWFDPVAALSQLGWIAGTITLAVSLYRARRVPAFASIGLVVAFIGAIPLAIVGGGIVTGAYWMAVGRFVLASDSRAAAPAPAAA